MESFLHFAISIAAFVNLAEIAEAQSTCQTLTATQISQDIQNSPTANQTLRSASCVFGGAGVAESGGNSCSSNGNNFGILQLTRSNLPPGMTPEQYLALSPQQQIDIWAQQVGNSNTTGGYQTLANNSSIGGATVTPGMMADGLHMPANTLSFHLKELTHSGLVTQERASRFIIYRAAFDKMNTLLGYLTENCCQGSACAVEACADPNLC